MKINDEKCVFLQRRRAFSDVRDRAFLENYSGDKPYIHHECVLAPLQFAVS